MDEEKKENRTPEEEQKIRIDYDNIDVEDIMRQIRERIAARPKKAPAEGVSSGSRQDYTPQPEGWEADEAGIKGKAKRLLLKLTRPFSPVIKLLVFPLYQEMRQTVINLDQTNRRLDAVNARLEDELNRVRFDLDQVNQVTNQRLDTVFEDIVRIKEYTKLLHHLSHNLVVELTKLKIEEEHLKNAARILEKDFAHLGKRGKALEKELFK